MIVVACKRVGYVLILSVLTSLVHAQTLRQPDQYSIEAGVYSSSSLNTPFWLRSNQYGIVPFQSPIQTLRFEVHSDYDSTRSQTNKRGSRFSLGYGLNLVANRAVNKQPYEKNVLLPEAYIKARLGIFELYAGRRREKFGLADSTLSTGSYSWSGNAMPIPKIQLSIPTFTPIGITNGWVSVQGTYAHGWFSSSGFIQNTLLHQKSFYVRLGREKDVVRVYGGFNHQVVWGGRTDNLKGTGLVPDNGKLPSTLRDYYYVVVGDRWSRTDSSAYTNFEITNRVGNHLGSIDVGMEIDLVKYTLFMYRQNLYEDGSLFYLLNIQDGLNGFRIRRNNPNAIVRDILFEYLNTTDQGGPIFQIGDPYKQGKDNYFNNQQYRDGWGYKEHTIGTPFIPPAYGPNGEYPFGAFTSNNRVMVYHLGMSGSFPIRWKGLSAPITYQTKLSYSQNYGTYDIPYRPRRNQFSGYFSMIVPFSWMGGIQLAGSAAIDDGTLYQNGFGTYISLKKVWNSTK
ncbi:capsule assembly Wzi family protein [Spirosoma sp. KUDC1026]|nr:capsule assembly Wzi family protein [Spirosoma sp. KUDC1026]QKZ11944.1 capsule assembly Wzi family protein [Spirosoma sp. KUDC1026]